MLDYDDLVSALLEARDRITDQAAVNRARELVRETAAAEAAWHEAIRRRDEALRAAVAANPDAGWRGLVRAIGEGLTENTLRKVARS